MKLVLDEGRFDGYQAYFIFAIMESVKTTLEEANLSAELVRDLTEKISFSVACIIDGSQPVEVEGEVLNPILTFAPTEDELIHIGSNSHMHEYVFGNSDELFGDSNS